MRGNSTDAMGVLYLVESKKERRKVRTRQLAFPTPDVFVTPGPRSGGVFILGTTEPGIVTTTLARPLRLVCIHDSQS